MKDQWQLSEEEQEDLRREMREDLEKMDIELKKKKGLCEPLLDQSVVDKCAPKK